MGGQGPPQGAQQGGFPGQSPASQQSFGPGQQGARPSYPPAPGQAQGYPPAGPPQLQQSQSFAMHGGKESNMARPQFQPSSSFPPAQYSQQQSFGQPGQPSQAYPGAWPPMA